MHCVVVVGSDGDASVLDVERELVGGTLGEVDMLAAAVLVVVLELPLKIPRTRPRLHRSRALRRGLVDWFGVKTRQRQRRRPLGEIHRSRSRRWFKSNMETQSEIACEEGTTGHAHFLPCPAGVPRPLNGGNHAIGCAWRR